ncbi:hypothetical protein N7455_011570 [Penicillium solitum]|uniref:uncharacterized protein n=1 Tax=Penicillium solitum TaxID=60172 RepID=UPI0032C3F618|nr:hypothetical protein N7455_011570 [Penicillium solitum]
MTLEEYQDALLEARKIAIEEGIIETLDSYNLDALFLPAWTEMSIYAAWAQAPTVTVPLGKYRDGKPYGLGFVAPRFDDGKLLQIMNLYEKAFPPRAVPQKNAMETMGKVPSCLATISEYYDLRIHGQ